MNIVIILGDIGPVPIGVILGLYWGYIGRMKKTMETKFLSSILFGTVSGTILSYKSDPHVRVEGPLLRRILTVAHVGIYVAAS